MYFFIYISKIMKTMVQNLYVPLFYTLFFVRVFENDLMFMVYLNYMSDHNVGL